MKKSIILLFIIIGTQAFAQVPGYQGKRFIFSYTPEITTLQAFSEGTTDAYGNSRIETISAYLHHNFKAEYVLDRKFAMAAEFTVYQDNMQIGYQTPDNSYRYFPTAIKSSCIALDFLFYGGKNSPLAPVGSFFKLKLFSSSFSGTSKYGYKVDDPLGYYHFFIAKHVIGKGSTAGVGVGFGYNHIVYNRVVLSAGIDADLHLDTTPGEAQNDFTAVAYHHISLDNLVCLKLGVGGLFF